MSQKKKIILFILNIILFSYLKVLSSPYSRPFLQSSHKTGLIMANKVIFSLIEVDMTRMFILGDSETAKFKSNGYNS